MELLVYRPILRSWTWNERRIISATLSYDWHIPEGENEKKE
jgi:hypothetical protein